MTYIFDEIILRSIKEDAPFGDITTDLTIDSVKQATGSFIAVDNGVICGLDIAKRTFELLSDGSVEFKTGLKDGDNITKGDVIATVNGDAKTILLGERTALNLMQRASGIATMTKNAINRITGTNARITDTRKTMPGLRILDKYAVRCGGAANHRFSLSDGILIKDNHIIAAGGIKNAVKRAKDMAPHTIKIEVEVESVEGLTEALAAGADIIMLDNMSNEMMAECVKINNGKALLEASGRMGEKDLYSVAATGIDLISIGALTHSVKALDISLKFKFI